MRDRKSDAHRPAAEAKLGRKLSSAEDIDHLDGDKDNQSGDNLRVMPHGAHSAHTNKTRGLNKLRSALRMHRTREKLY